MCILHDKNPFCPFQEVDQLKQDSKKVLQALKYTQDVVDKNILQQLPGSATIVLETIMEVTTNLLGRYLDQDRSVCGFRGHFFWTVNRVQIVVLK